MNNKVIFILSGIGVAIGLTAAYFSGVEKKPLPPVFNPAPNPYAQGIFANGMVESLQNSGENINIYPEVTGVVSQILVTEGQAVSKGTPLLTLDDSVQKATTLQLKAQADAALVMLEELKHQPRKEVLEVSKAQMLVAKANLLSAQVQLDKQKMSFALNPQSVSRDTLDNQLNAVKVAEANFQLAARQYELTKAGAWHYDIETQQKQYQIQYQNYMAANALLEKYTLKARSDGVILAISAAVGSYLSPQGVYGSYTQDMHPVLVMGSVADQLAVRCYIDEILVPKLPATAKMQAKMFIRGTNTSVPLAFVRIQPYISPKIQLSNQKTERVDVRVLPILFRIEKPADLNVYPGQLVDVYVGEK
ncbi:biotin/lipoyl-binding protein [Methylomonas paludis]|uniref:Biotin/lipoyl-binding protein n=1 Tax=Methylomonas paludis TaxID=1173101 RepID=A0A975MKE1_9GAMM|nr:biotin/lipoyl-binding protein [Methylomonas paludis]QWF69402.1 biotin/lipoyl-binding protein [Methylomonas paludis]